LEISLPSIILDPRMGANIVVGFYDEMGCAWGLDGAGCGSGLLEEFWELVYQDVVVAVIAMYGEIYQCGN